jgi:thioredoxin-like negative regulator of GroEL
MEQLAKDYAGKIDVYGANLNDAFDAASDSAVTAMPTVVVFKGGKLAGSLKVPSKKEMISGLIDQVLKS